MAVRMASAEEMALRLAALTGLDAGDEMLRLALDDAIALVVSYLGWEGVPQPVAFVVARIARDAMRAEGYGRLEPPQEVESVRRGDVTVAFRKPVHRSDLNSYVAAGGVETTTGGGAGISSAYLRVLRPWRKVRW